MSVIMMKGSSKKIGNVYFADFPAANGGCGSGESLAEIVTSIKDAVAEINRTSKDIASSNRELGARAEEESRRVDEILGLIDGVVFESNILALNAALEAGRYGEHNREITQIAAEIRSVVDRSAAATREIRKQVRDTISRYEAGAALTVEIGRTMDEIVRSVRHVTVMMAEAQSAKPEPKNARVTEIHRREPVMQQEALFPESA